MGLRLAEAGCLVASPPVVHEDGTVVSAEPQPSRIVLRMEWPGGAYREYTAVQPLEVRFAVAPSDGRARSEPQIALMFAGNPDAGGVAVSQEGVILWVRLTSPGQSPWRRCSGPAVTSPRSGN